MARLYFWEGGGNGFLASYFSPRLRIQILPTPTPRQRPERLPFDIGNQVGVTFRYDKGFISQEFSCGRDGGSPDGEPVFPKDCRKIWNPTFGQRSSLFALNLRLSTASPCRRGESLPIKEAALAPIPFLPGRFHTPFRGWRVCRSGRLPHIGSRQIRRWWSGRQSAGPLLEP